MDKREQYKGTLLVLLAAFSWSTAGLFTHLLDIDVWAILFWRSIFASVILSAYLAMRRLGASLSAVRGMGYPGWFVAVVSTLGMIAFIPALKLTTVANVAVIYASMPLIAVLFSWALWGEKIRRKAIIAGICVLGGAIIIVGSSALSGVGLYGDLLALLMTMAMAIMASTLRRFRNVPVMEIVVISNILGALSALPFSQALAVSSPQLAILALFGVVQMVLGLALFSVGAKYLPASETALIGAVEAPLSPLWVWLAFGAIPKTETFIGGAIIMGAVLIYLLADLRRETPVVPFSPRRKLLVFAPAIDERHPSEQH